MRIVATPEAKSDMVEMVKLMPTMEFTAVGKSVSLATDPANLDALLAGKPRGGVPPKSVAGIGAGWDLYCDMDLCRSTRLQGEVMAKSNPQLAGIGGMFAALKDGDVILSALAIRDGRVRGRVVVPYAMGKQFTAMGQAAGRRRAAPEEPAEPAPAKDGPGVF
jgi:hypothetical protein